MMFATWPQPLFPLVSMTIPRLAMSEVAKFHRRPTLLDSLP